MTREEILAIPEVSVGTLVYVDDNWHRVLDTRAIEGETEYLLASFYWWVQDRWVSKEKVEKAMVDTGQFD